MGPGIFGKSRKNGRRITGGNLGGVQKINLEKKSFQKVKSVVDGRIDKAETRGEPKEKSNPRIKRIKKPKN